MFGQVFYRLRNFFSCCTAEGQTTLLQQEEEKISKIPIIIDFKSTNFNTNEEFVKLENPFGLNNYTPFKRSNTNIKGESNNFNTITDSNNDERTDSNNDELTDSNSNTLTDSNSNTLTDSNNDTLTDSNNDELIDSNSNIDTNSNNDTLTDSISNNVLTNSNNINNNLDHLNSSDSETIESNIINTNIKCTVYIKNKAIHLVNIVKKFEKKTFKKDYQNINIEAIKRMYK